MQTLFVSPAPVLPSRTRASTTLCSPLTVSPTPKTLPIRRVVKSCVEPPDWKRVPIDVDFAKDEQLQILEEDLDHAVTNENYQRASEIHDKLRRLQSGAYVEVLSANMKFYQAFNSGAIVDMAGCWLQDSSTTCKHPLGPMSSGYLNIINSFGMLFSLGIPTIEVKNVRISMRGTAAIVTCEEHSVDWDEGEHTRTIMCAINIFVKRNGQWYLSHHSSMPILGDKI